MDINPALQNNASNPVVAAADTSSAQASRQQAAQQINPAEKGVNEDTDRRDPERFNSDQVLREAAKRNFIRSTTDLFNYRVTRYNNEQTFKDDLTFTNVKTGEVTQVPSSLVGSSSLNA